MQACGSRRRVKCSVVTQTSQTMDPIHRPDEVVGPTDRGCGRAQLRESQVRDTHRRLSPRHDNTRAVPLDSRRAVAVRGSHRHLRENHHGLPDAKAHPHEVSRRWAHKTLAAAVSGCLRRLPGPENGEMWGCLYCVPQHVPRRWRHPPLHRSPRGSPGHHRGLLHSLHPVPCAGRRAVFLVWEAYCRPRTRCA